MFAAFALLGACGGEPAPRAPAPEPASSSQQVAEDEYRPSYGKAELQRALFAERGAEATAERIVAELEAKQSDTGVDDRLRVARADLEIRRRFIVALEVCQAAGLGCPPRLDDPAWAFDPDPDDGALKPPLDAPLRFDRTSWQTLASELHGRACACRTLACIDSMGPAIDYLESRPMPEVQGDELASDSITRARQCLFRLRGKRPMPAIPAPPTE
ncbi:MAG: hypothetical protein AB7P03_17625 [Kofleriaceae bacterium]